MSADLSARLRAWVDAQQDRSDARLLAGCALVLEAAVAIERLEHQVALLRQAAVSDVQALEGLQADLDNHARAVEQLAQEIADGRDREAASLTTIEHLTADIERLTQGVDAPVPSAAADTPPDGRT